MEEYTYELRVPKERVAVLIGKRGSAKKSLEGRTSARIHVDSKEGIVIISGSDSLMLYHTKEVVRAIGRGFNPDLAQLLLKLDYVLEVISIPDYVSSRQQVFRLKGRVIGTEGKSRRIIEELADVHISVYGKTISILGESESVAMARHAVDMLLRGATHSRMYHWLEKKKKGIKTREMLWSGKWTGSQ